MKKIKTIFERDWEGEAAHLVNSTVDLCAVICEHSHPACDKCYKLHVATKGDNWDSSEGQTHYENDGCGEPKHNSQLPAPRPTEGWEERFLKLNGEKFHFLEDEFNTVIGFFAVELAKKDEEINDLMELVKVKNEELKVMDEAEEKFDAEIARAREELLTELKTADNWKQYIEKELSSYRAELREKIDLIIAGISEIITSEIHNTGRAHLAELKLVEILSLLDDNQSKK